MWEFRLVWTQSAPLWWSGLWERAAAIAADRGEAVEERSDLYLVTPDRLDLGLKLRGGAELEIKTRHRRVDGWELWEKCPFFRWNALEAARMANMLRVELLRDASEAASNPVEGAKCLLSGAGISFRELVVPKRRIQSDAGRILDRRIGYEGNPSWLAELAVIHLPGRPPASSICLETCDEPQLGRTPLPAADALVCGYPELLVSHLEL